MSWQGIEGHDAIAERFAATLARGRLASSFLFVGPEGVGKLSFALALAKAMLCTRRSDGDLAACGTCSSCVQAAAGTHPDILRVAKPEDKSELPIELLIGDREHRMRTGLCYEIGLKPLLGRRKFALIDDADFLNEAGANSLLKTLEEPPPGSVLILISTSLQRQLPTIRSRCQVIRFSPLSEEQLRDLLLAGNYTDDPQEALSAAQAGDGGLAASVAMLGSGWQSHRQPLLAALARSPLDIEELETALEGFSKEQGGKKSKGQQAARDRSRQALGVAIMFYRQWLRGLTGGTPLGDALIREFAAAADRNCRLDAERVLQCLERVLEGLRHLDRNAYSKLWPLSLAADLAAIYDGKRAAVGEPV